MAADLKGNHDNKGKQMEMFDHITSCGEKRNFSSFFSFFPSCWNFLSTCRSVLVGLAFFFAIGILLNVLAAFIPLGDSPPSALVLIVIAFYVLAPWPNIIFKRCGGSGGIDLDGSGNVWKDMGYFITGFLIVSGLALPVALQQAGRIGIGAMIMSIAGGVVLYATVAVYQHFFSQKEEF
jgi:hypothetical protein